MDSVKIDRQNLLGIVKENAIKHLKEYDEAVEDYKKAVLKIATDNLKLAKSGDLVKFTAMKAQPQPPQNYATSYSRAIRMLELSVEEVIDIEQDTFNQLVLDEWHWKNSFVASGALYKSF